MTDPRPRSPRHEPPARPALRWSVIIGVCAASAVLWALVIMLFFSMLGQYLRLQAEIVDKLTDPATSRYQDPDYSGGDLYSGPYQWPPSDGKGGVRG